MSLSLAGLHVDGAPPEFKVYWARSFWQRARGLLGRQQLLDGGGLLIQPCNSIHTFGMSREIDVLFLASDGTVLASFSEVKPNSLRACFISQAVACLELASGTSAQWSLKQGSRILFDQEVQGV